MASILYLGTDEGVVTLKSEDGRSWKVANHALKEWSVPEVAVMPSAPNRVFAGTRGDGVWLSEDFGATWKKPSYGRRGPGKVRCLTIDPRDPDTLYAGTEPIDVFISRDAGKSWDCLDSVWDIPWVQTVVYPVAAVEPHVRDIVIDPKDPKTMYVALQVGYMLKTTDGGARWELLNHNLDADVHTIALHPENTKQIFIATGGHDARAGVAKGRALYSSDDGGKSWQPMAAEFREEYSVPLVIHPKNSNVMYSAVANGQPGAWRRRPSGAEAFLIQSTDGGKSWKKLDNELSQANRSFVESFTFDPANSDRMFAAQRNGDLFGSDDSGANWFKLDVKAPALSDMKAARA
ncbi:MAG: WD40/YVTN/BNR-like repeat-containing protein [Candidatus Binatia bacterium]